MRYEFKLEALRRYRQFQEEALQKEFSIAQRQQEMETKKLSSFEAQRSKTEAELKQAQAECTTSPHLSIYNTYLKRIAANIAAQRLELGRVEKTCELKRQALVLAMQKRKTLEKLKEHGFKAYLQNLNKEEEKFINEMAINRFILNPK